MTDIELLNEHWQKWLASMQNLRFGQYLINEGFISAPNPELFYEIDCHKAYNMAFQIKGL